MHSNSGYTQVIIDYRQRQANYQAIACLVGPADQPLADLSAPELEQLAGWNNCSTADVQQLFPAHWLATALQQQLLDLQSSPAPTSGGPHYSLLRLDAPSAITSIEYGSGFTPFGEAFIAWCGDGICQLCFLDSSLLMPEQDSAHDSPQDSLYEASPFYESIEALLRRWPAADLQENNASAQTLLDQIPWFGARQHSPALRLLVRGSDFQLQVWQTLLSMPYGSLSSYGDLANSVGRPNASQAVGNAVGANPIGWLIPCHRIVRASGEPGGYRWGLRRKMTMLMSERCRSFQRGQFSLSER
ncbi:methylated-DNA--[protein]-cysteine S-methyltransferase [Oceanobacter mangrovi]|uniref:methylated-DNA--[protein]-cysteine S-methyltransferase n=1 Tax=Oceanobacter mangrovi TaxID=2862510 RepID=UPI001C8D10A2|nr:methylated-DNA--[protein]-cysteine S-methyltransferase [Oceanobacter mangrovi]